MTTAKDKCYITTINFALQPDVSLRVSLHKSIQVNPHDVVNQLLALPGNAHSEKFAIMDARRILNMEQITIAANNALLRKFQFELKNGSSTRGIALETILCCAGSTNTGSVLREYAFDKHSMAAQDQSDQGGYDIFLLGFCESDEEFEDMTKSLELGMSESEIGLKKYFSRERNDKEMNDLMKVYKVTKDEVEMYGSSLEKAIINRVASKFHT